MDFFDSCEGGFGFVENNKCLVFGFEVGFNNDIDYIVVFGEDDYEGFFEWFGFDVFFEVVYVDIM